MMGSVETIGDDNELGTFCKNANFGAGGTNFYVISRTSFAAVQCLQHEKHGTRGASRKANHGVHEGKLRGMQGAYTTRDTKTTKENDSRADSLNVHLHVMAPRKCMLATMT